MRSPLFLATLALLPCVSFAEPVSTVIPPDVVQELSVMTSRLNLSQSQQDRIRPILIAEWNKKQSIEGSTVTDQQKHNQIGANHRSALQKIKVVFTPQQMAQIEQEQNHPSPSSTNPGAQK